MSKKNGIPQKARNPRITLEVFKYISREEQGEWIFMILMFLLTFVIVVATNQDQFDLKNLESWYGKWLDPIITIPTFFLAFYLWLSGNRRNWQESLPKKLDVHFVFVEGLFDNQKQDGGAISHPPQEGVYVMSCYNTHLQSEHDIRAYAQQVGKYMNQDNWIQLSPFYFIDKVGILQSFSGAFYISYRAHFVVREKPPVIDGHYLVWKMDFEDSLRFEMEKQPFMTWKINHGKD